MTEPPKQGIEDHGGAVQEGGAPRAGMRYRIRMGNERLEYQPVVIGDPVPTGRQILEAAELLPATEHVVFQVLKDGMLEELRLDETTDLRSPGVERFVAFRSDRSFRFELDDRRFEWGAASISGATLKKLADADPATHGVWLERTDEPDLLLADEDAATLSGEGVERFRTRPIFLVCLEGELRPWLRATITTEELAQLGGWEPALGVIEVNEETQEERTLAPGEVITLKPGLSYGKKLCWKRGRVLGERIEEELMLLGQHYGHVEHTEVGGLHWFRVPGLHTPEGWSPDITDVVFFVTQGYPGAEPYGFFVSTALVNAGAPPSEHQAPHQPPFQGTWRFLSWAPNGWRPTADVQSGSNLWAWVRSFVHRLKEGR